MVHTSGAARRRGPRAGDGRRDAGRRVPSARRVRRHSSAPSRRSTARRSRSRATTSSSALLARMAEAIGATAGPARARARKPAYHAAAVLAAGGFVALLDAIAELGRVAGLDEAGSLAIYGPLIEQTLANARALGIGAALTGPIDPRRRGHARRPPRGAARATRPDVAAALPRRSAEREIALAEAPWRADTGGRRRPRCVARRLQRRADAVPLPPMERQHRRAVRGPSGRALRPPVGPGARAPARPRARPARSSPRRPARRSSAGPASAPLAQPPRRLARGHAPPGRDAPPTAGRGRRSPMRWARSAAPGATRRSERRHGAVARLRTAHRHFRRRHRRPLSTTESPQLVVGVAPARARRR